MISLPLNFLAMNFNINAGIRGLIFDLDGTLADTMPYHFQAWKRACKKYGADIEPALLKKHTGSPGHIIAGEVISKFGLEGSVTVKEIVQEKIQQFHKLQYLVKPIEPVADIVRKYHGKLPRPWREQVNIVVSSQRLRISL